MEEYIGKICPFCKTEIKSGDAVKVCPACCIPHHESCWEENKGCTTFGCSEQHYEPQGTNPMDVCPKCGVVLGDGQEFCPKCGTPKNALKPNVCGKCGAELQEGQEFCPKCGQKVGLAVDTNVTTAISHFNSGVEKKNKKKVIIPVIITVVAFAIIAVLFFIIRGTPVEEIILSKSEVTIEIGESVSLTYTISPDDATDKTVIWSSSNESIATVSDGGCVTAKQEGACTITVTTGNGKADTCTIQTEEAGPDFESVYSEYCSSTWASVASDGSYLSVDTNPDNIDDYTEYEAYLALYSINSALGLPESLIEKMGQTRALDGRQTETYDKITVSWTYHPDNGLEVMYEAN